MIDPFAAALEGTDLADLASIATSKVVISAVQLDTDDENLEDEIEQEAMQGLEASAPWPGVPADHGLSQPTSIPSVAETINSQTEQRKLKADSNCALKNKYPPKRRKIDPTKN